MSKAILEVKNVSKTFRHQLNRKKIKVVKDLSCSFYSGQCTGFLGHNGAGKTTTLKMILGLVAPDQGDFLLEGKTMQRQDRQRIGYMPESDRLPMTLNSLEVLNLHLRMIAKKGLPPTRDLIRTKLEQVNLWHAKKMRIGKMSKGMRRRLAWAMATIHDPDILILDEPFSGLDPVVRHDLRVWITDLKKNQKTIILCTHELWAMSALCDQVYIMKKGELVYSSETHPGSGANFKVRFANQDVDAVKRVGADKNLAAPSFINLHGHYVELGFEDYAAANAYVQAGLGAGLELSEFNSSKVVSESEALKYF